MPVVDNKKMFIPYLGVKTRVYDSNVYIAKEIAYNAKSTKVNMFLVG